MIALTDNKYDLLGKGQHDFCKERFCDTHLLVFFGEIFDLIDIVDLLEKMGFITFLENVLKDVTSHETERCGGVLQVAWKK